MTDRQIYKLHASICHTLANPKRLEIIDRLQNRELSVTELAGALEISQANLSQHLAIMRQRGIVTSRREGLNVFYKLSNPKIIQACELMRQVLLEHLETSVEMARGKTMEKEPVS
ncbi:MAG: metalloregulator ArsR/SmtB family transcription factor [Anaerolineales bacterium]|nr:metalloregulator ArsR/SmtB family transcription factor [Anaerolineales bacterium]